MKRLDDFSPEAKRRMPLYQQAIEPLAVPADRSADLIPDASV